MNSWEYLGDLEKFKCLCGKGHYACWAGISSNDAENFQHQCCQRKCCTAPDFPGRFPTTGDVALCGRGCLGVITSASRKPVNYPNGSTAVAWCGYHLTNACSAVGAEWASRTPCILFNLNMVPRLQAGWQTVIENLAKQHTVANWIQKEPRTQITMASSNLIDDIVKSVLERSWLSVK